MNQNILSLLRKYSLDESAINKMKSRGEFVPMDEGFIWLVDKGDWCRLMCESVNRPWSLGFIKKLRRMQKACAKPLYVESEDPTTIELCRKAGATVVNNKRAEWGNSYV